MVSIGTLFSDFMQLVGLNHYTKTQSDNQYAAKDHSHTGYLTSHQDISGKANAVHTHNLSDISTEAVEFLFTYANGTTETLNLVTYYDATIVNRVVLTRQGMSFTATVTNTKGNGISGKTVILYEDNTQKGTGTTNTEGIITLTVDEGNGGTFKAICDGVESNGILTDPM